MSIENRESKSPAVADMKFIHLDECRERLCAGPVSVDRSSFVTALTLCTDAERRELADMLLAEKFGELR